MKFKQYLAIIAGRDGFIPTPHLRKVIAKNPRKTAREEAIAASVIEQANPRENITGRFPWGAEEQIALQQLWINPDTNDVEWRDVPTAGTDNLYTNVETEHGELPVPNAVREPGVVAPANLHEKIREALGETEKW